MKKALTTGALALLVGLGSVVLAQDLTHAKLDSQEQAFLRQRAQDDVFMWRLGEYAAEHGGSDQVKQLGKDIVKERRSDLRDIEQLAADHGADIKPPETLAPQQKAVYDRLVSQNTTLFDRGYTKAVARNYGTTIPQLERERDGAKSVYIREYAGKNLQMFKDHQKQAHDVEKVVRGT
jgi:predicted outer membrane protein